jgi:hypothetical protein
METLLDLHEGTYKRVTFYFPIGDEAAIEDYLVMPDYKNPGEIRDLHFKFCGQKLKKSAEFTKFVEEQVPPKFKDRCSKSEKGIDIEICCDAFKLASTSRLERLFLLTNDDDFIPFCRAIKEYGANISIIHLSDTVTRNVSLLREADSFDVVPGPQLQKMFLPIPDAPIPQTEPPASALKSDATSSDTIISGTASDQPKDPNAEETEKE